MKNAILTILLSAAMFAGGYAIASMDCVCGPSCACSPCNCPK